VAEKVPGLSTLLSAQHTLLINTPGHGDSSIFFCEYTYPYENKNTQLKNSIILILHIYIIRIRIFCDFYEAVPKVKISL